MINLSRKGKPNKLQIDFTESDAYENYVASYSTHKITKYWNHKNPVVDKKTFLKVNYRFYQLVIEKILNEAATFVLPFRLGQLRIQKKLIPIAYLKSKNKLKIDWGYWRKTGRTKYHLNEHRDYFRYKWFWLKTNKDNLHNYRVQMVRNVKRQLPALLLSNNKIDFFE